MLVKDGSGAPTLITEGALDAVLAVSTSAQTADGKVGPIASVEAAVQKLFLDLSNQGYRVLGVATRTMKGAITTTLAHQAQMTLVGFGPG